MEPFPPLGGLWRAPWTFEPSAVAGLALAALAYLLAVGPLRRRLGGPAALPAARCALFLAGLATIAAALVTPLDFLADNYLFSAHMVQHQLLVLVAPPLLLAGIPGWLVPRFDRQSSAYALLYRFTRPLTAFVVFNVVFAISHAPRLYDAMLHSEALHAGEHLLYLATALLAWWPLLGSSSQFPRPNRAFQMVYAFGQTLPMFMVGALITLSESVIYRFYAQPSHVVGLRMLLGWEVSPLADQRLGGLLMWLGGSLFYLGALTAVWFVWAAEAEAEDAHLYEPANGHAPRQAGRAA